MTTSVINLEPIIGFAVAFATLSLLLIGVYVIIPPDSFDE